MSIGELVTTLMGKTTAPLTPQNGAARSAGVRLDAAFERFYKAQDAQAQVTIQLMETTAMAQTESRAAHELAMATLECECPPEPEDEDERRKKKDSSAGEIQL